MMATIDSSPMLLGKRATNGFGTNEAGFFPGVIKRRRPVEFEEEGGQDFSAQGFGTEDTYEVGHVRHMPQPDGMDKRHRMVTEQDNDLDNPMYSQRHFEFLQHQHEEQLNNLREEYEKVVADQQSTIESLTNDRRRLMEQMQADMSVLKRGVQIQYAKTEELKAENESLKEMLTNAAEYIARAERVNETLRAQLAMLNCPSSMVNFQPPPDVF